MEVLDEAARLRRFCFLGGFLSCYIYRQKKINVADSYPDVKKLCSKLDGDKIVAIVSAAMPRTINRDQPIFVYAVYLQTQTEAEWRNKARAAFNDILDSDEDLFTFCKYAFMLRKLEDKKGMSRTMRKAVSAWYEKRTADELRDMWIERRGAHGFTHQRLIEMCHLKSSQVADGHALGVFFKTTQQLLDESSAKEPAAVTESTAKGVEQPAATTAATNASQQKQQVAAKKANSRNAALYGAVVKMRRSRNPSDALAFIRKFKLKDTQVPAELKKNTAVMEALLTSMSCATILTNWYRFGRAKHFRSEKFFKKCQAKMSDKELLRSEAIHPITFLLKMHRFRYPAEMSRMTEIYKLEYYQKLYEDSFGLNPPTGLRIHISINLQANYRKKSLHNYERITYLEAAVALAFSYFKSEEHVDVFAWDEDNVKMQQIEWEKTMSLNEAKEFCGNISDGKNKQRLVLPVMNTIKAPQAYDLFLVIVPTAGRGNPKHNSNFLAQFVHRYGEMKNTKTRYVVLDLLKHHKSMYYITDKSQNILEICGLDEDTPKLINQFGLRAFE